jgi:dipeptidase E
MLILTSSIASVAKHILEEQLKGRRYKHLLFVDTAAEPELGDDDQWFYDDLEACEIIAESVERFSVSERSRDEIGQKLLDVDAVYFSGGNTNYLLRHLQQSDSVSLFQQAVRNGMPYLATSAGSIIAGPRLPDYFDDEEPRLSDNAGFNFVPFTLVPHWGSIHFKERYLGERLKSVYTEKQDPLLLVTDTQYCVVNESGATLVVST